MSVLYIVATPIGNLEDITLRALRILKEADALACEDTRHTKILLKKYEIPYPNDIFSYHDHNEEHSANHAIKLMQMGRSVALCTDAGFPGVSDPGYRIVTKAIENDIKIEVIPGPSAVPTALLLSGLSTSSFTFKGFPPRKEGQRQRFIGADKDLPHTMIFFESKHRLVKFLQSALTVLGNRKGAVCLELTKQFEEVKRGFLTELIEYYSKSNIKGEITVCIAGNNPKFMSQGVPETDGEYGYEGDDDDEEE